jgi:excisionase family DNA binding protein
MSIDKTAVAPNTLLSTGQACVRLGLGKTKFLKLIRSGRIPSIMFDNRIRVRVADIDAFIDAQPKGYVAQKAVRQ